MKSLRRQAILASAVLFISGCGNNVTDDIHERVDFSDASGLFSSPIKGPGNPETGWSQNAQPDTIVALVDGTPVTRGTLEQAVQTQALNLQQHLNPEQLKLELPKIRKAALHHLILRILLADEATKGDVQVPGSDVEIAFDNLRKTLPEGTPWEEFLERTSLTEKAVRDELRSQLEHQALIQKHIGDVSPPTNDQITTFYEENKNQFVEPARATFRHLLLRVDANTDENTWSATMDRANELWKEMETKQLSLEGLVTQHSEDEETKGTGGLLENIIAPQLPPALRQAVFDGEIGRVGPPVRTVAGVHLVLPEQREPERSLSIDEVRDYIAKQLTQESKRQSFEKYANHLIETAHIEYP